MSLYLLRWIDLGKQQIIWMIKLGNVFGQGQIGI